MKELKIDPNYVETKVDVPVLPIEISDAVHIPMEDVQKNLEKLEHVTRTLFDQIGKSK